MADDNQDTLPLQCADLDTNQSVPCPELPPSGPTCDPDGTLPTLPPEGPEQPETITVKDTTGEGWPLPCFRPQIGNTQRQVAPGVTETGPGVGLQIGGCSGPGSVDFYGTASAGKTTGTDGKVTSEIEGPNAKGGFGFNSRSRDARVGAQANLASTSLSYSGQNGTVTTGASVGVGAEVRVSDRNGCGVEVDLPSGITVGGRGRAACR